MGPCSYRFVLVPNYWDTLFQEKNKNKYPMSVQGRIKIVWPLFSAFQDVCWLGFVLKSALGGKSNIFSQFTGVFEQKGSKFPYGRFRYLLSFLFLKIFLCLSLRHPRKSFPFFVSAAYKTFMVVDGFGRSGILKLHLDIECVIFKMPKFNFYINLLQFGNDGVGGQELGSKMSNNIVRAFNIRLSRLLNSFQILI